MKTLARRSPSMWADFPTIFSDLLTDNGGISDWNTPAVNIQENAENYLIEMAAPGMKRDDFKIELDNGKLMISSEWKQEKEEKETNYTRREFGYHAFSRSFELPSAKVDFDGINAKYEDGILKVTLPKREEAKQKPARMIEIG